MAPERMPTVVRWRQKIWLYKTKVLDASESVPFGVRCLCAFMAHFGRAALLSPLLGELRKNAKSQKSPADALERRPIGSAF